jgi:plant cysteine oxidase
MPSVDGIYVIVRLAKLAVDKVLSAPCPTSVLYPETGGNIHCFTAVTSCAVLDILTPPYEESAGRRCTYYRDYPYSSFRKFILLLQHKMKIRYLVLEVTG